MTIQKQRTVYRGRVVKLNVETVLLPNGHVADLEIIHHPGGAASVALDDSGRVCVLRQFRHAAGGWIWELPAGKLEPEEPPLVTARRELIEEAGYEATNWLSLGPYVTSPGVFTEVVHLFLATELRIATMSHEPAESIEVHWIDFTEACRRAASGDINDGKTALGLLRAAAVLRHSAAEPLMAERDPRTPAAAAAAPALSLSLEDTRSQLVRVAGPTGHNPYDTIPSTTESSTAPGTDDLRRLSQWIRDKRLAAKLKRGDGD